MSGARPEPPDGVRRVRESPPEGPVPLYRFGDWDERFPWLVHGTTGRGGDDFDLGLFGASPSAAVLDRWRRLRAATAMSRAVHGRQVHGRELREHRGAGAGLLVVDDVDGHLTDRPGILLTVATADCVPIALVDARRRRVALLHGGWRGTAAGIVEAGLRALGGRPEDLHAHLGPAICGRCYEVGPEVHEALDLPVPADPTPVDVRAVQARRLVAGGVPPEQVTLSEHCTRCGDGFYSHRGGDTGRQLGVLGIR